MKAQEFFQKWGKENNPFWPNEMRWDRVSINEMLYAYDQSVEYSKKVGDGWDYCLYCGNSLIRKPSLKKKGKCLECKMTWSLNDIKKT